MTQQEVMKNFMHSLDETDKSGRSHSMMQSKVPRTSKVIMNSWKNFNPIGKMQVTGTHF